MSQRLSTSTRDNRKILQKLLVAADKIDSGVNADDVIIGSCCLTQRANFWSTILGEPKICQMYVRMYVCMCVCVCMYVYVSCLQSGDSPTVYKWEL